MSKRSAISPTRAEDYSSWYQEVIKAADLAEHSPVRGCMVIKPWGYGIWENIRGILDKKFKATGHQNAYFPLFIPLSYFQKEATHVEGFATECAIVTHHRLEKNAEGKLEVASELEEPLIVRPTSEMMIGEMFAKWIESYRDLPLKLNQWANVVRWEMRTRLFLRTAEFLWQEGHTAHATKEEALTHTKTMLDVYTEVCKNYLALPSIPGKKTEHERFPGAEETFTFEMMMQDRKALQGGTSHFLGQNFAKASQIKFKSKEGNDEFVWTTSWGFTTRIIGAMIMVHSDDDGFVLPPKVAPSHIVIIPIVPKEELRQGILDFAAKIQKQLSEISYAGIPVDVIVDERDMTNGEKNWFWIKKGIPIRIEIGPKEVENKSLSIAFRHRGHKDKINLSLDELSSQLVTLLDDMHQSLYKKANLFLKEHTKDITDKKAFYQFFTPNDAEKPEIHGGFAKVYYAGNTDIEKSLKEELGVTIRCIPLEQSGKRGTCIFTGKETNTQVIFAKAY
ncbi:MAG: proline--tRNA ligase [Chlamydiales bacterium]|nr:proline--tRNA ligase [Chlamydiales bacterium]